MEIHSLGPEGDDNLVLKNGDTFTLEGSKAVHLRKLIESGQFGNAIQVYNPASILFTAAGYNVTNNSLLAGPTMDWDNISLTGTVVFDNNDDDENVTVSIGFDFEFMGNTYSDVTICTNGFLQFGMDLDTNCCSLFSLPSVDAPLNMAAAFWADLYVKENQSKIVYKLLGNAPNRRFVVSYLNVSGCCFTEDDLTFQITIYENAGGVRCQYQNLTFMNKPTIYGSTDNGNGYFPVNGFNNEDGTVGITYTYNNLRQIYNGLVIGYYLIGTMPPWE